MGLGNLVRSGRQKPMKKAPVAEQLRPELWLQPRIMEALVGTREIYIKPDMWLSPSVLAGWCPRAWVMAYRMGIPMIDEVGPNNKWWMDGGSVHHKLFQEWWMGPAKIIKGGWECPSCLNVVGYDADDKVSVHTHGETIVNKVTPKSAVLCPDKCPSCGYKANWRKPFNYIEPLLYDLDMRIVGWSDGILDWGQFDDELWDLKTKASTDGMGWVREAPDENNVIQINWYLELAKMQHGRLVYVDRASKHLTDAFIEHPLEHDPLLMAKEKEKVSAFREATKNPESSLPACPYGGRTRFGPCQCRDLASAWKDFGSRP